MKSTESIVNKIRAYQEDGRNLFATSSFQSHSIPLSHIISQIDKSIPIYSLVEHNMAIGEVVEQLRILYPDLEMHFVNQDMKLWELKVLG